jgi:hypothetical protein
LSDLIVESSTDDNSPNPVAQALERFKLASEADSKQRARELEDLKFVDDPDGQWPEEIRKQRQGGTIGDFVTPARPCLTFDGVTPAIDQVTNQARNAHLAVQLKPKGSKANQETADMLKGLYRSIEVDSKAHVARMWALERAAKCGRGYYRILKSYANDGDFDLDLTIARILNQHSVYLDPFHQEPDGSDAEWAFVVEDMPLSKFKRQFPRSKVADYTEEELTGLGNEAPGWINDDKEARTVRVAEYFTRKWTTESLELRSNGQQGLKSALGPLKPGVTVQNEREVQVPSIIWQTINAVEVLDEQEWEGRYIPIVQVVGVETNINGDRRYRGMVAKAKDAGRSYNYMRSKEIEVIGLASYVPWIIPEGVIEGYERVWNTANTKNYPYLPYKMVNFAGAQAPPPQRNTAEPDIQAIVMASGQAREDVQRTTATFDPSLGLGQGRNQSGTAIKGLQQQSEHGNSNYLENLAQISMTHEARIVLGLMPFVYDRPGRIARVLGEDGTASSVMLNQPFTKGDKGQPLPVQPGQPVPPEAETFMLPKDAEYTVVVTVGKSFSTQREEATAMMGQLAEAVPQMVPMYADLWVRMMDFPGKDAIADRFKKMLPPPLQEDENGQQQTDPAQLQAQNQQLTMQLQQMQQELQQAKSGIAQAQIKAESDQKIKGAELESKGQIAAMQAQIDQMKIAVESNIAQQKIQAENQRAVFNANHEHAQAQQQIAASQHEQAVTLDSQQQSEATDRYHAAQQQSSEHAHAQKMQATAPKPKAK